MYITADNVCGTAGSVSYLLSSLFLFMVVVFFSLHKIMVLKSQRVEYSTHSVTACGTVIASASAGNCEDIALLLMMYRDIQVLELAVGQ